MSRICCFRLAKVWLIIENIDFITLAAGRLNIAHPMQVVSLPAMSSHTDYDNTTFLFAPKCSSPYFNRKHSASTFHHLCPITSTHPIYTSLQLSSHSCIAFVFLPSPIDHVFCQLYFLHAFYNPVLRVKVVLLCCHSAVAFYYMISATPALLLVV